MKYLETQNQILFNQSFSLIEKKIYSLFDSIFIHFNYSLQETMENIVVFGLKHYKIDYFSFFYLYSTSTEY